MSFEPEERPSTCQLSPAFHHEFTIIKNHVLQRVFANAPAKPPNLHRKKNSKYATSQNDATGD
jgi:hypothetical protein